MLKLAGDGVRGRPGPYGSFARKIVTRSLLILVVTIVVVAVSYYGFSRFGANSAPASSLVSTGTPRTAAATVAPPRAERPVTSTASAPAMVDAATQAHARSAPGAIALPSGPPPGTFAIVIDKSHPPAPSDVIRVAKDDPVTLTVTSDRAGHVEVHGYRKEVAVEPGKAATLSFKAERTGRFPIDLHAEDGAHVEVTALEVMPR